MPALNVYLPKDLHGRVKDADLPVSRICQTALEWALMGLTDRESAYDEWREAVTTLDQERRK